MRPGPDAGAISSLSENRALFFTAPQMKTDALLNEHIVLFDGVCVFCNKSVNFIIRHDRRDLFRFAPLQSEIGKTLVAQYGLDPACLDSVVLIENGRAYVKTSAALHICRNLDRMWPLMFGFIIMPAFIRDVAYDIIAKYRYRWWGKLDACTVPTLEVRRKFLSVSVP